MFLFSVGFHGFSTFIKNWWMQRPGHVLGTATWSVSPKSGDTLPVRPWHQKQKVCLRTIRFSGVSCWFWGVYEKAMNCSIFVFHALWVIVFSCVIPFSFKDYVQMLAWFLGVGFFERVKCITQVCMCSSETKFLTETNNAVGDVTSAVLESRLKTWWSWILQNSLMQTLPCFLASSPSQMLTLKIIYSNPPHFLHLSL